MIIDKYQPWNTSNGLQSASVISSAINKQGEIFLSHSTGVQKCDGTSIFNYFDERISFGIFSTVYISEENHLYVLNSDQIIRIKNQDILQLQPETLKHGIAVGGRVNVVNETPKELWLHFSPNHLCIIDKQSFTLMSVSKMQSPGFYSLNNSIFQNIEAFVTDGSCVKKIFKEKNELKISECISAKQIIRNFVKISERDVLILSHDKVLKGNIVLDNFKELARLGSGKKPFRSSMVRYDHEHVIITFDNDVYLIHEITGKLIKIVKNEKGHSFFENGPVNQCLVDQFKNIYIVSLAEGIVKFTLPKQQVQTIHKENKGTNFVSSFCVDKENKLIVSGLFKAGVRINSLDGKNIFKDDTDRTPVSIWKAGLDQYFYTTLLSKNLFRISKKNGVFTTTLMDTLPLDFSYYSSILSQKNNITELINGFFIYSIDHQQTGNIKTKSIEIPHHSNMGFNCGYKTDRIYLGGYNEIIILDTFYQFDSKYTFKDKAYIRKLVPANNGNWWMASDKGLELLNHNFELLKTYTSGSVFSILKVSDDQIWCGTGNGIICIYHDVLVRFTTNDGFGCQEYNGHCAAQSPDGSLVFGGVGGIDIFDGNVMLKYNNSNLCLLSDLSVKGKKDIAKFIQKNVLVLPYNEASLSFSLSPVGSGDVSHHIIQYKMLGMNEEWINGQQNRTLNYQLSPGSYEFQYTAGKYMIDDPQSFKTLKIVVLPPYYKTWWFVSLVTVAIAGIVFYYFSLVNRIKFEKQKTIWAVKENLLNQRSSFTKELHDLIGSKISIVSRNIDFIIDIENPLQSSKKENLLVQTLQLSKQIAKDIRDTIWATDKDDIYLSDLVSRIKDFTFYYQHLPMKITIEATEGADKIRFEPNEGLNLLRIIQEAVHNAAKHSEASKCEVKFSTGTNLTIDIIDEGKGMPVDSELKKGNGLENMQNRANKIHYRFIFVPVLKGTHIKLIKNEKL